MRQTDGSPCRGLLPSFHLSKAEQQVFAYQNIQADNMIGLAGEDRGDQEETQFVKLLYTALATERDAADNLIISR